MKRYVLTGGPGSGKTAIALVLEEKGEHFIHEAAEDVIKRQKARGIIAPWEDTNFQRDVLHLQQQREKRIPSDLSRVFIDRGFPDGLAYLDILSPTYSEVIKAGGYYDKILLVKHPGEIEQTAVRREDITQALALEQKLFDIYRALGYRVAIINPGAVDDRAAQVLQELQL